MKVLIVDDDQLTATTWAMGFKSAGMEVISASNGQDGINQVKLQKPDIVLLDQIMPDMLGNAVLAQLKADPETANVPVMLISNYNENQMMKEAIEKGAIDYILKYQVETKDLVDKVQTLLKDFQTAAPAPTIAGDVQVIDSSTPVAPAPIAAPVQAPTPPQPIAPVAPTTPVQPTPPPTTSAPVQNATQPTPTAPPAATPPEPSNNGG